MPCLASTPVIVSLPGGLATDDGQWLRHAELRPLIGSDEDWLIRHPNAPSAKAVTTLLGRCLLSLDDRPVGPSTAAQLLVGDRDYLMLALRRLTLGEDFFAVLVCPACGEKMDASFKSSDVPIEGPPLRTASFTLHIDDPDRQRDITFRLPTGADQQAVIGEALDTAGDSLLSRCVLDDGGISINAQEKLLVADCMERNAPKVEVELDLLCPNCEHKFTAPFDTTAFFLQELRSNDRHLLREFHALAFHYHWSQTEIMGLDRERRRTYLSLLADELRRE
jgi:hypothetical protein